MPPAVLVTNILPVTTRSAQTKARLQACALELFTARGYDATTVEQIAAAAGVSHMTFFRHFPTKEAVLMDDPYDPLIADAVRAQPTDLPPMERVRRALLAAWRGMPPPTDAETRARIEIIAQHPALRAKVWEYNLRTEDVIVSALTEAGTPALTARVAAGAVIGAIMAGLTDWGADADAGSLGDRVLAALDLLESVHGVPPPTPARS